MALEIAPGRRQTGRAAPEPPASNTQGTPRPGTQKRRARLERRLPDELWLDYRRYRATGTALFSMPITQGFWAGAMYRIGHAARSRSLPPAARFAGKALGVLLLKASEVLTGISVPPGCEIGSGLYIGHFGAIHVHPNARLGANCSLSQGVTLGAAARGGDQSAPRLGDRVFVGPHAVVAGGVTIGNDVVIGAGAIVLASVPDRAVMVGNPAHQVSGRGSFDLVFYDGMYEDPARLASLAQLQAQTAAGER